MVELKIAVVGLGRQVSCPHLLDQVLRACVAVEEHEIEWVETDAEYKELGIATSMSIEIYAIQSLNAIKKGSIFCARSRRALILQRGSTCHQRHQVHQELEVMAGFSRFFNDSYHDAAERTRNASRDMGSPEPSSTIQNLQQSRTWTMPSASWNFGA
ncbi:hypothetical protein BJX63DRAFT_429654 [Aspergillus granulosus]|uniref:Uncharacterized protein n=1 Tax=Aspergillus granulosus TaxID=176169 RepID=A0ABR4HQ57_9EURO